MFAIFKREFRAFYTTPIGYVFSGVFIMFINILFYLNNVRISVSDVKPLFAFILIALMALSPILTMRLISEEKKMRTEQLLLTAPIRVSDIIIGKFLAAMAVFLITMTGTFIIPAVLAWYKVLEFGSLFGNYVASIAAAAAFISVGLFISSLTENQLVAALLSWAVLIGMWLIDFAAKTTEVRLIRTVIGWLSLYTRYAGFTAGVFNLTHIIYYISITSVFIFLTIRMVEKKRYA